MKELLAAQRTAVYAVEYALEDIDEALQRAGRNTWNERFKQLKLTQRRVAIARGVVQDLKKQHDLLAIAVTARSMR